MTNPFALDTPATAPAAPAQATAPATSPAPAPNPFGTAAAPVAPAQPSPVAAPDGGDPFDAPAPQQARGPRLREMYGRLLLVVPVKLEEGLVSRTFKNPDGSPATQDRMTANVTILDGGTIHYGGQPEKMPPVPHSKSAEIPMEIKGMFISGVGLISQCRDALAKKITQGRPGMVLGRLTRGEDSGKGEPPWLLTPPTEDDKNIARQYLATRDPFA